MQEDSVSRLRKQLRRNLLEISLQFGPTYPIRKVDIEHSESIDKGEFNGHYPEVESLSHYTDAAGLKGIIETGNLWATNVAYLNDPEEFRLAYRKFDEMVSRGEHALETMVREAFLYGLRSGGQDREAGRAFIISFSARKDDLSQFRAYSDNARGYALEFKPVELIDSINEYLPNHSGECFTLRRVRYGESQLELFHEKAIGVVKRAIEKLPPVLSADERRNAIRAFGLDCSDYLREAGIVFKQEGYKNESEFRAVLEIAGLSSLSLDMHERLRVRFRGSLPVPYIPIQFAPDAMKRGYLLQRENTAGLQRIVVGPGIDFGLAEDGIFYLLRQSGMHVHTEVVASKSSYRLF